MHFLTYTDTYIQTCIYIHTCTDTYIQVKRERKNVTTTHHHTYTDTVIHIYLQVFGGRGSASIYPFVTLNRHLAKLVTRCYIRYKLINGVSHNQLHQVSSTHHLLCFLDITLIVYLLLVDVICLIAFKNSKLLNKQ